MKNQEKGHLRTNIKFFRDVFLLHPNRLFALRATVSMGVLAVPFIIAGLPFFGVTLALGALAGALSETDDHPKGRVKSLSITIFSFFISSFSVGLLNNYTWILGAGFIISTIVFILIGGIGERYRAITFGSVLVGIYAMLGIEISPAWYWQAILLPAGALFHGILTLILIFRNPWRLLDQQMAGGFQALSNYLDKKALLFPSDKQDQEEINKDLALLNINVVNSLERIKNVLNNYGREMKDPGPLNSYLQRFMLLQSLHERAASTHDRHDKLGNSTGQIEILEGFGEMLRQLAHASRSVAENMLTGNRYHHPPALEWISKAIDDKLETMPAEEAQNLILLHHNLHRSHISLLYLDNPEKGTSIPRLRRDERTPLQRLKEQLTFRHPRMRYALRLSITFALGYVLQIYLNLDKGQWVMLTSLFVSQITYSDTRRRLLERLLGTASGIIIGAALLQIFTTPAAQVLLMMGSAMAFFLWLRKKYSVAVIFVTTFVLSAFNLISNDGGINIMIPRLVDTLLGASLSFLTIRFLWPGWQFKRISGLIATALEKNRNYFQEIAQEYQQPSNDDLQYRIARREAHLADNELAQAWNSMRQEPKSKQHIMENALTITYLNHALLSHISALGVHRETNTENYKDIEPLFRQIDRKLTEAGKESTSNEDKFSSDLSELLIELQQQIKKSDTGFKRQQLRLFYNIAATTSKIIDELKRSGINTKNQA
ncbi:FUSC family membrane protein [uncultured Draconibacterium sp.]|uniref:FUSC family membrane protein n=1 Tax=uncultured Draconibacterium sp. TaxID=1573823 RepID=UPI0029C8766F|nr:FUSC family membrane protein [uncultured Draconibacterium sp.]